MAPTNGSGLIKSVYPSSRRDDLDRSKLYMNAPARSTSACIYNLPKAIDLRLATERGDSAIRWARKRFDGHRRAIVLERVRRIASNTAQRTSIRFCLYIWNMQGGPLT
jgi:hypothetical protein